jgi:hydrogenase expression/formation protein HypC
MCLGIPGQVVEIADEERMLGVVDVSGVRRKVNLACAAAPDAPLSALIGEWVLVHVGFAMSRIDAAEAQATLEALDALGEAQEEIAAIRAAEKMMAGEDAA